MKTSDGGSRFPRGSRGGVSRVTQKGKTEEHDEVHQHWKPDQLVEDHFVTVGMAASIGQSTEYGREKYEISAWCSLPVSVEDQSIREGYEAAYDYVMTELERRHRDVQARFFSHLTPHSTNKVT